MLCCWGCCSSNTRTSWSCTHQNVQILMKNIGTSLSYMRLSAQKVIARLSLLHERSHKIPTLGLCLGMLFHSPHRSNKVRSFLIIFSTCFFSHYSDSFNQARVTLPPIINQPPLIAKRTCSNNSLYNCSSNSNNNSLCTGIKIKSSRYSNISIFFSTTPICFHNHSRNDRPLSFGRTVLSCSRSHLGLGCIDRIKIK
jgi:hypothetical protein